MGWNPTFCLGLETSCAVLQFCVTFSPRHVCLKTCVNCITAKSNIKHDDFVQSQTYLRSTEMLYLQIPYYPRYIPTLRATSQNLPTMSTHYGQSSCLHPLSFTPSFLQCFISCSKTKLQSHTISQRA